MKPRSLEAGPAHEHTRKLLSRYREAWLDGNYPLALLRFRKFRRAVTRHLAWEAVSLVQPLRYADRHRLVRSALDRIGKLLPEGKQSDVTLDLRILVLVAGVEEMLDEEEQFAAALPRIAPAQCN